jgi:hypothetical protein
MRLIKNPIGSVSSDTVREFEGVLLSDNYIVSETKLKCNFFKCLFFIYYLLIKIGFPTIKRNNKYKEKPLNDKKHLFMIMLGIRPYGLITNHNRSIYLFDAWPKYYNKIMKFVRDYCINYVFVSSSQAVTELNYLYGQHKFFWIPEGINPYEYKYRPYEEKDIEILAIGRRYDEYHYSITPFIENKYIYLYEKEKGDIIFPTHDEFINGLARTKISICVPSNITHPERAGHIETMTARYLQSIVSKCLIVGHAPKEMIDLFGYNPVIEIDMKNPVEQLEFLLKNYSSYFSLMERNYHTVLKSHTWKNRWSEIKNMLNFTV